MTGDTGQSAAAGIKKTAAASSPPTPRQKALMDFEQYIQPIIDFVRQHQAWAAPIVAGLCFAESLAFISLLIPAWAALVGIGAIISASGLSFWPILVAGAVGAALGD